MQRRSIDVITEFFSRTSAMRMVPVSPIPLSDKGTRGVGKEREEEEEMERGPLLRYSTYSQN